MKKKSILIIGIIFTSFLVMSINVRGGNHIFYTLEFNTDKTTYYNEEQIQINVTWYLQYDTGDNCYNEIRIYNETNNLVWSSDPISDLGEHNYIWTVWIQDLNTSFNNDINTFKIKIYCFWHPYSYSPVIYFYEDVLKVTTIKRNITCDLEGFKNPIKFGESLNLKATFYNTTGQYKSELENYQILFKVYSNGNLTFNKTYVTNSSGMIETISLNKSVLPIGINILSFTMQNDTFFTDLDYSLSLRVIVTKPIPMPSVSNDKNTDNTDNKENDLTLIASVISIICLSFAFLGLLTYKNYRKNHKQSLDDISFRY